MSEAVDLWLQDKVETFDRTTSGIEDAEARNQLRREFLNRAESSLAQQVARAEIENDTLRRELSEDTYRKAGIPEQAHELIAKAFEGDHRDIEAVRAYGQEVGLVPTEPKPGGPDYVWNSPAERRAYEEGQTNE